MPSPKPVDGAPCWVDLQTSDPERARAFYPDALGWTALETSAEFGGYFMFTSGGVPVAGCMPADAQAPMPDVWSVYLASSDVTKTLEAVPNSGGQVVVPPMPITDLGTMAFVVDPSGAGIGVWQPGTFAGFGVVEEVGAPAWFELHSRDHAAAVRFYTDAFGWTTQVMSDTDEFRYTLLVDGEDQLAGIMDASSGYLPPDVPSHWTVYFAVADTDAAIARVTAGGGTLASGPDDTPFGRIAVVTDPMGAMFRLHGPNLEG